MATPEPLQEPPDFSLVLGGPLYQMLRRAHLTGPALELVRLRVVMSVVLCWVALAVLSLAPAHFLDVASWYASPQGGQMHFTMAGYWFAFISIPVFQFILLRWYMRILIWFWFLLRVSRLKLHLLPAHPDRAGGLGFVGRSSFAFVPLLFAQGALLSGQIASHIFYNGQTLLAFKMMIAGFVIFFVFPL